MYWLGAQALRPFVTLRLDELGASDAFIGSAVALSPMVAVFAAIPGGRLVDRVGARRILVWSLAGMAVVGEGFARAETPIAVLWMQAAIGIAEIGTWLALQALITHAGTGAFRTRQLSLFAFGWGSGVALGPVLGAALFESSGFALLGRLYTACALLGAATVALIPRPAVGAEAPSDNARALSTVATVRAIGIRPVIGAVLLSSYVNLAVSSIRGSFYPLFLERQGLAVPRIGVLLSVVAVMSLAIRLVLPPIVRRFGVPRLLVFSMAISTLAIAITPFLTSFSALALAAAAMGVTVGMNPPLTVELMAVHTSTDERGVAMGMRITANRLAQVAQPVIFTVISAVAGMAAAFPVSGIPLLALTGWTSRKVRRDRLS